MKSKIFLLTILLLGVLCRTLYADPPSAVIWSMAALGTRIEELVLQDKAFVTIILIQQEQLESVQKRLSKLEGVQRKAE